MHSKFSVKSCHNHKQLKFDGQKIKKIAPTIPTICHNN